MDIFSEKEVDLLRSEILGRKFNIAYQPIVSAKEGKVKSLESLFRLENARYNNRIKNVINFAKKEGFLNVITDFMLDNIVSDFEDWRSNGFIEDDFFISFNVDHEQLNEDMLNLLLLKTKDKKIKPCNIFIEIKDSKDVNLDNIIIMNKIYDAGFKIAIDSIVEEDGLIKMPYHMVKIDKNFIKNVLESESMEKRLVDMIVAQKNGSKVSIVCQGIESKEQTNSLVNIKSDYHQGYLYSKPVFKSEIISTIRKINGSKN